MGKHERIGDHREKPDEHDQPSLPGGGEAPAPAVTLGAEPIWGLRGVHICGDFKVQAKLRLLEIAGYSLIGCASNLADWANEKKWVPILYRAQNRTLLELKTGKWLSERR
jgi:hypothetical protein